ncbi:MAG: LysR substrate-binding domain-containing protein [Gammaproteobacteria bacterium]
MNELHNLWSFVQVAAAGSFSAAAARLAVTPAALSKSVARLEAQVGARLFTRTTRALHLTSEGQALFDSASRSLAEVEAAIERVRNARLEPAGLVRLSTVTAYGRYQVVPILPEFLARHPRIDLRISFHDAGRGPSRQADDVRITWGEEREREKVARLLCRLPLVLIASPAYLARRGTPKTPADLEHHECIAVALPNVERARWELKRRQGGRGRPGNEVVVPRGRVLVADELDACADAALAGLGITAESIQNVGRHLQDGTLVRVLADYEVQGHSTRDSEVIIQYHPRKYLAPRVRVLVDYLIEKLQGRDEFALAAK